MDARTVVGRVRTLSHSFYGDDGETPADPTDQPTITITRDDGTVLVAATATVGTLVGPFTYVLPLAAVSRVDSLVITWTATIAAVVRTDIERVEVAGGRYLEVKDLRDGAGSALSDIIRYPAATLDRILYVVERRIEAATGVAWVPRYRREQIPGPDRATLVLGMPLPRQLFAVSYITSAGVPTALVSGDWSAWSFDRGGMLTRSTVFGSSYLWSVAYEHGHVAPTPDLRDAALKAARSLVLEAVNNRIPDRATLMQSEGVTFNLATADARQRPFGIPDVDAVVMAHVWDTVGVG